MSTALPTPPAAAKPQRKVGAIVLAVVIAFVVVGWLSSLGTDSSSSTSTGGATITAEQVVDALPYDQISQFCDSYRVVGVAGLPAFEDGYGDPLPGGPTGEDVFYALAARC